LIPSSTKSRETGMQANISLKRSGVDETGRSALSTCAAAGGNGSTDARQRGSH
jgi:hypothetical protein